ncbi:hypothetical protein AXF42_Ash008179 [Apostasia shenzhenica]|uniref:Uncharacterized protein n=1 Tax=Apostasia shenzhenica TaxID=1088818 RepID=A0A2I0A8S2_9ASPA|nr:hypothetical protein AXF42_Ash008179 [Apostasia shenzhenica]
MEALDSIAGVSVSIWQDVLGAILGSYHKLLLQVDMGPSQVHCFVSLAKRHKSRPRILSAVAEYLDSVLQSQNEAHGYQVTFPGLDFHDVQNSIGIFVDNLSVPNKEIRVSTLRILSHYPILDDCHMIEGPPLKKLKHEESDTAQDRQGFNVVNLLLSIETSPISISTSRKIIILISRLHMALTSRKTNDSYLPLVLNGIIGILHNRFSLLWEPALECLTTLIGIYKGIIWNQFFQLLEFYQLKFLSTDEAILKPKFETSQPKTLIQCFSIYLAEDFESNPCKTVMALLLQALQKIPDIVESHSRQLVPLFLKFLGYTDDETLSVESFTDEHVLKGKEHRSILKDWLNLLKLMHSSGSLYRSQFVKDVLVNRLLDEIDSDIQVKVIDCLLNWKDDYLIPYVQNLKNLVFATNLREELTTWSISKDSKCIQEDHRAQLVPIVVRLLTPKVRKLKSLASRKHAGVSSRRALLCFLSQLDIDELHLFFCLLLKPLNLNLSGTNVPDGNFYGLCGQFAKTLQTLVPTKCSVSQIFANLSWKKKYGFLYVLEDILKTFDAFHIRPFFSPLMMIVALILEDCSSNIKKQDGNKLCSSGYDCNGDAEISAQSSLVTGASIKQLKDLRSLCLRIVSFALNKHDSLDFGCEFWDTFFKSVKPLIDCFKEEASSSEKPSSLFTCFIAMSQSPKLVSLLSKEANLVPTIFSILTVRTASDAIISSVLKFVEGLLNLDSYPDHQDVTSIEMLFYPHLEVLIHSFHGLFQLRQDAHRKSTTLPRKMELRIFKMIMKYINNPLIAAQFLDILLPLFKQKGLENDDCLEALHVLKGILQNINEAGNKTSGKILKAIHPILATAALDVRRCICDIISGLSLIDPCLTHVARLLHDLNAVSATDIDELDYDTVVSAYETIRPELFSSLGRDHSLPILSNCIFHVSSNELILRQCASKSLFAFVKFAAAYLEVDTERHVSNWTKDCILGILKSVFLKNMGDAMTKDISVQNEWITLLREMVYNLREVPDLRTFRPLCSEDPEVDFFNNIFHLQVHKRRKALLRFRDVISAGNFTESICVKIFVPLFWNMMLDVKAGKGEHLRDACLDTFASISSQMRWESYCSFLSRCFNEITIHPDNQKILVRLICAVLDKFHFSAASSYDKGEVALEVLNIGSTSETPSMVLTGSSSAANVFPEIQIYLQNKFLPQIQKLLTSDTEKVNANISLAAIKILKLLPAETMDSQLSSIIHHSCSLLKNRLESVRDDARSALAACTKELGLEYLHFIVKALRANLKRGYEMHVLGYSLNFILSKTLSEKSAGSLDYCLEELLSLVENDILGDVAQEKEVDKLASKMKETRKNKSFETLKLISQNITFAKHAMKLLFTIREQLAKHLTPKSKKKLEMMLFHIASGIECNPSAGSAELFIFVYGLVEDSITNESTHAKGSSECAINLNSSLNVVNKGKSLHSSNLVVKDCHLISVFALGLLHSRLKNMKLDENDQQLLSMLDPFVRQMGECLNSKYEDVVSAAFRCLAPLIKLPLPSLGALANKIKTLLLQIAQRSGNGSSLLLQSCLKLLTVLLRSAKISLSHTDLHMLIQFPVFVDIQICPSPVVLSLLKSIVGQKLVVHEIFDIILKVAELMVTSQTQPIREKCSQILLRFLLHYNLSEKRMLQHLNFLLTNLSYEHASGREAVLEMLHTILMKFPKGHFDSYAETFFLHLVVALANERDQKVLPMVAAVLKELIDRSSQRMLQPMLEYSLTWYFGEKQFLWAAAAQVIGLLIEVLKKRFRKHIASTLRAAKNILQSCIDAISISKAGFSNALVVPFWKEAYGFSNALVVPFWKEAYYTVLMLEKILFHFPELYFQLIFEDIWGIICKLLLHPHIWLRNISSQLVALYFAAASRRSKVENENVIQRDLYLLNPIRLFIVAVSFLKLLETQQIDIANSNIINQNLAFSICGVHSFAKQSSPTSPHEFWSMLDASERISYLEAFDLLGSTKAKRIFVLSTSFSSQSSKEIDVNALENEDLQSLLVVPLFKRLVKIATATEDDQMKIIFNCLRTIASQIDTEGFRAYAAHMLIPLYKVCEGFTGKVITDEIKQLAEEVLNSIRDLLGVDFFIRVYNEIRKKLKGKRDRRRQQQRLIAAVNPMLHAKRKLRAAAKHRAHKRRKIEAMKMGRRTR